MFRLGVLGPLEIRLDGRAVEAGRPQTRKLLALLATRPNEAVPAERLIEDLWEGVPPPTATSALRVHIGRARSLLSPPLADGRKIRLTLESGNYVLHAAGDQLDSLLFEAEVKAGRDASVRGDVLGAAERLTTALQHWRGPAFLDARELTAAQGEAGRLEQLKLSGIEELAGAHLALRDHAASIELLASATAEFPLHERFTAQLMLALYRSSRQAEALRAFRQLAERLDEQLGVRPCSELRQLEEDILLQRRGLDIAAFLVPPPQVGRSSTSVRLIGRRSELSRLIAAYDDARTGNRRFALVSGEAGIGKTTLVGEFCDRSRRTGAAVMVGQCFPAPRRGYEAIIDALAAFATHPETSRGAPADDGDPGNWMGLDLGANSSLLDANDRSSDVLRLLEAIATVVSSFEPAPVLLVVEDLHWADVATLRVLRHLLRHPKLDHLMVVATQRDEDVDADLGARIGRLAPPVQTRRLVLSGFDEHEVRALIRNAATQLTPHLVELAPALRDLSGGNPFHLRALFNELDEGVGIDSPDGLVRTVGTLAPEPVRALLGRRLTRLSPDARDVLRAAAGLGRGISIGVLVDVCKMSSAVVRESIEELLDARLLHEDDWQVDAFVFPHALVQNAIYEEIPDDERTGLHLGIAQALEARQRTARVSQAELAYHYAAAFPLADAILAAEYAVRAGDEAAIALAFDEAASWYEQALRWRDRGDEPSSTAAAVELALGRAYEADHQFGRAGETFLQGAAHARESRNSALFADLAIAVNGPWTSGLGDQTQTRALLESALESTADVDPMRRLNLLTTLATSLYYTDVDREGRLAKEAHDLAETIGDLSASCDANLAQRLWLTHEPEARRERLAIAADAMQVASRSDSPRLRLGVGRSLLTDLLENADVARFDATLEEYELLATQQCSPRDIYWSMALRATQATLRGDLSGAEQLVRGAQLRGRELHQESSGAELLQRVVIRYQQGRLAEEVGGLTNAGTDEAAYRGGSCLAALAQAETGRAAEGARLVRWAIGSDGCGVPRDAFWLGAHALFASVASRARDIELAALLAELLTPCAGHVVVFGAGGAVLGCGHHWLGLLHATCRRWQIAVDHLREAERISESLAAPYWRAQAQVDLAMVLKRRRSRSDENEAQQLLGAAISCAEQRGFGRLLVRASVAI